MKASGAVVAAVGGEGGWVLAWYSSLACFFPAAAASCARATSSASRLRTRCLTCDGREGAPEACSCHVTWYCSLEFDFSNWEHLRWG